MNYKIDATIEIPLKTKNKFEINEQTKKIRLDRVLYSAMNYPAEYGFIEDTYAHDKDPLDILVITSEPTFPGCIVPARIIGYLEVIDNGYKDYKLISVVDVDPRYNEINDLDDLSQFTKDEIKDFFNNYKTLQNITVTTKEYHNKEEALKIIKRCQKRYQIKQSLNNIKINSVQMKINHDNYSNIKAFCEVTINDNLSLGEIRLIEKNNEYKIAFEKNDLIDIEDLGTEFLRMLEKNITKKYLETIKKDL